MTDALEAATGSWDVMIAEVIENIRTAGPIVVQTFTAGTAAKAEAIPVVPDLSPSGEPAATTAIPDRPVWYPAGAGFGMVWPLQPLDVALGICSDRSLAAWQLARQPGEPAAPPFPRFHALDQMQVLPLTDRPVLPQGEDAPGSTDLVMFGPAGTALRIQPDGTATVQAPAGISSITMAPDGSVTVTATVVKLAGEVDFATKGDALITAMDTFIAALVAAGVGPAFAGAAAAQTAWNGVKNTIKSTLVKVGG